jgi:hypothetical protein
MCCTVKDSSTVYYHPLKNQPNEKEQIYDKNSLLKTGFIQTLLKCWNMTLRDYQIAKIRHLRHN